MKNTAKVLALILCAAMVLTMSGIACAEAGIYAWEKYEEPVTIRRAYAVSAGGDNYADGTLGTSDTDNIWTRWYKETYNIIIENAFEIDSGEYAQKIDLLMASGDLPDVFIVTTPQLKQCVENGYIADLTEVFEDYASEELKHAEDMYELGFQSGFFDGKLYGISKQYFGDAANMQNVWYRLDWAQKLGIEKPTTMEEFKDMCIAFRDQDPDGNGIDDTLPLTLDNNLANGIYTLMFAYGAYPNVWIEKEDGTIEFGGVQPEAKEALSQLNEWYNEGIISKDWATASRNDMKAGITGGTAGVCLYGSHIGYSLGVSMMDNNPDARLGVIAVPSATDEPVKYAVAWPISSYIVVNANFEHPEAVIKCLNGYTHYSVSGTAEENSLYTEMAGGLSEPFRVNVATDMQQSIECIELMNGASPEGMLPATLGKYLSVLLWTENGDSNGYGEFVQLGPDGGYAQLRPILDEGRVITDMLRGPQTETMAAKWSSLDTLLQETYTKIICGQEPIEYFDEFVEKWMTLGGEQITVEMNEVYGK